MDSKKIRFTPIENWLLTCMILVASMVWLGGITRLTESGLSIVEWNLFSGIFPPLTQSGWEHAFAQYKTSAEFVSKNYSFSLNDFKQIFWLEYFHRLLGRITGFALLCPFVYFLLHHQLSRSLIKKMSGAIVLVGLQGTVGWIMVQSGLENDPRVSPFKLALHLLLAFSLFGFLFWTFLGERNAVRYILASRRLAIGTRVVLLCVLLQIILGAFVAGLDAGLIYNTYPLMDNAFIPKAVMNLSILHDTVFANVAFVQFAHRMGALLTTALCITLAICGLIYAPKSLHRFFYLLALVIGLQFFLGVMTLIHVVPIALASAHQMTALILCAILLYLAYLLTLSSGDACLTTKRHESAARL